MNATERLAILTRITEAVLSRRDMQGFFDSVALVIRELFPTADDFGVARYFAEKHFFEVVATSSRDKKSNQGVRTGDGPETPGGFLMRAGRTTLVNDFDAFESQGGFDMRGLFPRHFASAIGSLLEHGGKTLGYFYVSSMRKNAFEERHRDIFELIRGLLALAFENAIACEDMGRLRERAEQEGEYLRAEIREHFPPDGLIGSGELWRSVCGQIAQVAPTESTVLIQGETGTGKELIARAIHEKSRRAGKPLIKVNCGALPENLVESELFGHEKGSFTGAMGRRIGRFELADGGTIFLDEIGEMPMALQIKLLRVLQEREFERVGGEKPIRVNVRVIAATNRDLSREVAAGRFRADLYYRLNVFPVLVPPLRSRPEDAVELAEYFAHRIAERLGRRPLRMSESSRQAVANYSWPGNVRELEHLVERGIILAQSSTLDLASLLVPNSSSTAVAFPDLVAPVRDIQEGRAVSIKDNLEAAEKRAIETALAECNGVVGGRNGAAARLGLKRQTLQSKMKKLGILLGRPTRELDREEIGASA